MHIELRTTDTHKLLIAFTHAPKTLRRALNGAMVDALKEISKRTPDGGAHGGLFMFKTPREKRTGMLAQTFRLNIATGMTALATHKDALRTEVHSTVEYADGVASQNDYYARILKASTGDIRKHFTNAINNTLSKLV